MARLFWALIFSVALAVAPATGVHAQCERGWTTGDALAIRGPLALWDPDGLGPQEPLLVVARTNSAIDSIGVSALAAGRWIPLGSGMDNSIRALAALPNGDLIAAGDFLTAGGVPANRIARWNGTTWSPLGSGIEGEFDTTVSRLLVLPNGDLVAIGRFSIAGGVPVNSVARWDGISWSSCGSIFPLAAFTNGNLVGVGFDAQGRVFVARWDGSTWTTLGSLPPISTVSQVLALQDGSIILGGEFYHPTTGGLRGGFVRWTGTNWAWLGPGSINYFHSVDAVVALPNGDLVASGLLDPGLGSTLVSGIARWNGTAWSPLGGANSSAASFVTLPSGELIASGAFSGPDGKPVGGVARWNGTVWSPLVVATSGDSIRALFALPNGDVLAAGAFESLGGVPTHGAARWNGTTWSSLSGSASSFATLLSGDVVAGGYFPGNSNTHVARWTGNQWEGLGVMPDFGRSLYHWTLAALTNGDLIAAGSDPSDCESTSYVMQWNGTTWSAASQPIAGSALVLSMSPDGNLFAAGYLASDACDLRGFVKRRNGLAWSSLGADFNGVVSALAVLPNGQLVAGGGFTMVGGLAVNHVAQWNGTEWLPLGTGLPSGVLALAVLPGGDIVAGGSFGLDSGPATNIARWNGTVWNTLGSGANGTVRAITLRANGDLIVGGGFTAVGGKASALFARYARIDLCSADFNCSGSVEVQDILDALNAWFANDPRADFDGSGVLAPLDILSFIALWFEPC